MSIEKTETVGVRPACAFPVGASTAPWIPLAWQGGLWKLLSCVCFAGVNGIVRYVTGGADGFIESPLPYVQVVFMQNFLGILILLPFSLRKGVTSLMTRMPGVHAIRVITAVGGLVLWYAALSVMPLAEAVALSFTGPIFTLIGARMFLKEPLTKARLVAIVLSILGAFVIMRPDLALGGGVFANLGWLVLLPLLSATAWVAPKLSGRILASRGESPRVMALYLLVFMAPVSFIPAVFQWVTPTVGQFVWVVGIGILSTSAYLAIAKAYALSEVSFLMPFGFARFLLSVLVGFLAFGEFPQTWSMWIGICIILLSLVVLGKDKQTRVST